MKRTIIIGESPADVVADIETTLRRAEAGDIVEPSSSLSFQTMESFLSVVSPKRLALLRHLHDHPTANLRELARQLGRDYKRVHGDVVALRNAGLIDVDGQGRHAVEYDSIDAKMRIGITPPIAAE